MTSSILDTMTRRLGRPVSVRNDRKRNTPQSIRERIGEKHDLAKAVIACADQADRDMSADEKTRFDRLMSEIDDLKGDLVRAEAIQRQEDDLAGERIDARLRARGLPGLHELHGPLDSGHDQGTATPAPPLASWLDASGNAVYALARGQRLVDLPQPRGARRIETPHAIGHIVSAFARGSWDRVPADIRAQMSGSDNSLGGVMVPSPLANQVFDYARAQSAVWKAGATTVAMDSDELLIARQVEDPTMELKGENAAFTLGDLHFDAVRLVSRKLGAIIVMSRELAADAPNAAEVVSSALAKAIAVEVDRLALVGGGGTEPTGLENTADIGSTTSVGAIAWEDLHTAAVGVRAANHVPSAYIAHPTICGDLDIIVSGDADTSAKLWLGAPPSLAGITRYESTNATTALLFLGDFSKLLIGVRQAAIIEMSTEAGDFFAKHQMGIKITVRLAVGVSHPAAFHVLSGITT